MKAVVRRLLPASLYRALVSIKRRLRHQLVLLLSSRRWLANVWYGLVQPQFSREIYATKKGQLQHARLSYCNRQNHARLRRNTHRLEKGLLMRPRRATFGQAYLAELISDYSAQVRNSEACTEELQWAHNVLREYFDVVKDDAVIVAQRATFDALEHRFDQLKQYKPYARSESESDIPNHQLFNNLCQRRRSVRWFKQQPVPRALLEQAVQTAALAPSACNRQPFDIYVIDKTADLKQAVVLPMGTKGWADNIPMLLVFVGDLSSFEHQRDRHVPYVDASLAAMSLMLALETLGLASCPINWPDIESRECAMAKLLKLSPWQRPIMCLAVGYADEAGNIAFSQKRSPNQLIRYLNSEEETINESNG